MKILVVEDDGNKLRQIVELVRGVLPSASIAERRSYQGGLEEALMIGPELMLLDMTMPTYDISPREKGGRTRPYGGREILWEIVRKGLSSRVIVVTQFESFGEGSNILTLRELIVELERSFPKNYVATVFYQAAETGWRTELTALLKSEASGLEGGDDKA